MLIDAVETQQIVTPIIDDLYEINNFFKTYPSLSYQDCACLYLANELKSMLFTGENPLRKIADKKFSIEVHGSLYIFDELIRVGLITPRMAYKKLNLLITGGTYLPYDECQKRLRRWKRKF